MYARPGTQGFNREKTSCKNILVLTAKNGNTFKTRSVETGANATHRLQKSEMHITTSCANTSYLQRSTKSIVDVSNRQTPSHNDQNNLKTN